MYSVATNQDAHDAITAQFSRFKDEKTSRAKRLAFADQLTEAYFALHGYAPPSPVLDRLATLILQDELADKHPDKMTREDLPILSDRQRKTRIDKESTVSDMHYGRDKAVGFVIKTYENDDGTLVRVRKKLYDFPH